MNDMTLKIGNVDLTPCLVTGTYKVNEVKEVNEWTDANYTKHSNVLRTKVKGSFTLKPYTQTLYERFIRALSDYTNADNATTMTVYVNNTGEVKTIKAKVTNDVSAKWVNGDRMWFDASRYTIEEL